MVSSSGSHSANHKRYSSPRGGISPYAAQYADRRTNSYIHNDSRSGMMSDRDGTEEPTTQRKRIAVACMRCRKRKIRCTGDSGNGQPCLNCKNAGFEPCQFLRVSSHETHLKNEQQFSYSLDVARNFQARGSSVVSPMPTTPLPSSYPEAMHMPSGEALSYRNGSAYAYGNKYYPVSGWSNGYVDDSSIDYSVYPQSYQPVQQDATYMVGFRMGTSPTSSTKPSGGSTPLYVEPDTTAYGYPAGHAATATAATMVHRPAPSGDASTNFVFQGMTAGLANPMSAHERMLPTPSTRSLTSAPQQHPYRAESISSAYSKTSQSSTGSSSPAALSEAATTYNSFESSPLTSYPTPTATNAHLARGSEAYTTAATSSLDAIMAPSDEPLRMTAPEMTYKYTDTTRRYASTYTGALGGYLASSHGHSHYTSGDENDRKSGMRA
ncbi:n-terminal fungal transcription factor-containing [Trichoderma arundinaceum]|uniref:N-terminal fungal transcription factor-containing n=1 Tax=Trichoderma arundinaceum TaxID=490622 RepID=A0A395NB79_TRIAR|nr:n-terminal fungal transcription factor-containing [Trichoderma arundinaceum]